MLAKGSRREVFAPGHFARAAHHAPDITKLRELRAAEHHLLVTHRGSVFARSAGVEGIYGCGGFGQHDKACAEAALRTGKRTVRNFRPRP